MTISIRVGTDADAGIGVLHRSITQLCQTDHKDDASEIAGWLSNKTVEAWNAWADRRDACLLFANSAGGIVGVGMVDSQGEILLAYVHPGMRFQGVSKAMLRALEVQARALGAKSCFLESTLTAQRFYETCGYRPVAAGGELDLSKPL